MSTECLSGKIGEILVDSDECAESLVRSFFSRVKRDDEVDNVKIRFGDFVCPWNYRKRNGAEANVKLEDMDSEVRKNAIKVELISAAGYMAGMVGGIYGAVNYLM